MAVQCLETLKYCWCVHTDTGEPIPGTSLLNAKPHCEEKKPHQKPKKHRKRCLGRKRLRFLRRLISAIKAEMIMTGNTVAKNIGRDAAVKWKFGQLDVNENQVLERNEWKSYKYGLIQWKKVKHCSRNLFKICDTDSNSRLTTEEWKNCITPAVSETPAIRPDQLNPFLYILKAD
ncbi:hypothetical protein KIN20_035595 [Parelaphostrongylus tenuis]|uniref:Uncharacterized protein n=1 Tax=Parelaphostrongylus tenuis TaxID=148309 RepID=A0AAD5WKN1_PARTN|nr:hypothetical protein KIN20_035595 [Parelaphostrongylus tenuis]